MKGDHVVSVGEAVKDMAYRTPQELMEKVIINFAELAPRFQEIVNKSEGVSIASVRLRSPLTKPTNIDCMADNYMEDRTRSELPLFNAFHKSPSAIIGDGDAAAEAGRAAIVGHAVQFGEQFRDVGRVVAVLAAVAGAEDAGGAAEGVDFEP